MVNGLKAKSKGDPVGLLDVALLTWGWLVTMQKRFTSGSWLASAIN